MNAVRARALGAVALLLTGAGSARAADFDAAGRASFAAGAVATSSFEVAETSVVSCENPCIFETRGGGEGDELPLEGTRYVRVTTGNEAPFELDLALPASDASYRFRAWVRHARALARAVFEYAGGREDESGWLYPSGRVSSDGWVELESNPVSVTGSELSRAFLRVDGTSIDLDAIEVVEDGAYDPGATCFGAFDPVCGSHSLCIAERCRHGDRYVPPLPPAEQRESVAGYLMARIRLHFGGQLTRAEYMPLALAEMEKMNTAATPWAYWSAFAHGIRLLHDWHTYASSPMSSLGSNRSLSVCFIEGRADLTQNVWPSSPGRADILVSHVIPDSSLGLKPGDRLVAVDGKHPIDWARALIGVAWSYHPATDPDVDAEFAEAVRGLIPTYARSFSVIRCNATDKSCSDVIESIDVRDLASSDSSPPRCDNRPSYHLANPPGDVSVDHRVPFFPWRDAVVDSAPGEAIYGMTWDNLGTSLTDYFRETNTFFKENARGVILDHRAGNGGTLDAPEAITELVRTPFKLATGPGFMPVAAFDGPSTADEGKTIFERFLRYPQLVYDVGSNQADLALPVALLIHRDGSASDWLPLGLKGAPKVKIFGPHETAGAFSSFYQFGYWGRIYFQIASGDTITFDGQALIGRGIEPDVIVEHTQSSLLEGRDAPYDAALAWVRDNLK